MIGAQYVILEGTARQRTVLEAERKPALCTNNNIDNQNTTRAWSWGLYYLKGWLPHWILVGRSAENSECHDRWPDKWYNDLPWLVMVLPGCTSNLVQNLFAAICIQGSCAGNKIHVSRTASTGCCDNEERNETAELDSFYSTTPVLRTKSWVEKRVMSTLHLHSGTASKDEGIVQSRGVLRPWTT